MKSQALILPIALGLMAGSALAETIVVTERGYQAMQKKASHPLIPDRPSHAAQ